MSLLELPNTSKGVLIALAIIAVVVSALFASTLLTVAVAAVIIAILTYLVYIVGSRIHRWLLNASVTPGRSS
ncbi:hypothetical protein SAMN05216226_102165 [Halovenus aranensis]|uniref:Uncharacterized protein n=1 Tax=Halovenus aranensis TaxID=890420 RepID=A0A1G8SV92_9EURY|nr:hypothetical protein [Halovenus aranensis]SDJ33192.1 hypothetical protein SAMN05216226_102165 [Halovenus aranensis]